MSSGKKTLVYNTQERAISPDVNRAQAFAAKDDAESWRYLLDVDGNDDQDAGGVTVEHLTLGNPLRAEVFNGLLVRPQPGSLNLTVDPGLLYAVAPDGDADASVYKFVRDAGAAFGTLAIGAGAVATRIDVIECQIDPIPLTAVDNRDIFDPITGLFTAVVVTKETQYRLTYRVRAGTAGGGFPGTVLGWLPLCVASVPAAAGNVDTMTFWDVRPLLSDRAFAPMGNDVARPIHRTSMANCITLATATGLSDLVVGKRRLGGMLRSGSAGVADADSIDVSIAANQEPGTIFTANRPWYLYLLTPFGLPRWARYNASGSRVPRSPRGIPVVSMVAADANGAPSSPVVLPNATGLVGATNAGTVAFASYNTGGGSQSGVYGDNNEGYLLSTNQTTGEPLEQAGAVSGGGTSTLTASFTLTSGTNFPTNARSILVEPRFTYTPVNGEDLQASILMQCFSPNGGGMIHQHLLQSDSGAGLLAIKPITFGNSFWLSLPTLYPSVAGYTIVVTLRVRNFTDNLNGVTSNVFLRTLGWKF